jgi:hypothetical protein
MNRSSWIKKKLFTVKFKGRKPRALLWKKAVYEEWFYFAKMAQERNIKIPKAFGNLSNFDNFEDWWRDERYGFELFCEPYLNSLTSEVVGKPSKLKADEILVKVNLKGDLDLILRDFNRLLRTKDTDKEYVSQARFQPSRPMKHIAIGTQESDFGNYKRENKLKTYRETFLLFEELGDYKEVAIQKNWLFKDISMAKNKNGEQLLPFEYQKEVDNKRKKVKRHVEQVKQTFENVSRGTFP